MMAQRRVTDRAERYRAQNNAPDGPKVCYACGSRKTIELDHIDGHESHNAPDNLMWLCRSCNATKANVLQRARMGRVTSRMNPTKSGGAATVGEWMAAVGSITHPHKGKAYAGSNYGLTSPMTPSDAVAMIRATPHNKRQDFAAKLRRKNPATRENIFGWGKPAPVAAPRRGRTGGLSLTEASSAALKAGRTSGDLSDFDSWLERKHLDTRSDGVISRIRDAYSRGVDKADADDQNRQYIKDKREEAKGAALDRAQQARDRAQQARDERSSAPRTERSGSGRARKAEAEVIEYPSESELQAGFARGLSVNDMLKRRNPGASVARLRAYLTRRNPAAAAAEGFEEFHGYPPSEVVTVSKQVHHHKHLASAGDLVGLQVKPINGGPRRTIEGLGECFLAFNEAKNQLFIEGGDQRMSPAELKKFGVTDEHELQTLGKLVGVGYFTDKKHLGKEGGEAVYSHTFRGINEDGKHVIVTIARDPDLIYRVLDEQFEVSGGSYEILREGINK